jgi:hypothetical protein
LGSAEPHCARRFVVARIGLEVVELLEPQYDPEALRTAVIDVGGELPTGKTRRRR